MSSNQRKVVSLHFTKTSKFLFDKILKLLFLYVFVEKLPEEQGEEQQIVFRFCDNFPTK